MNKTVAIFLLAMSAVEGARILAILPTPVHSHKNVVGALLKILSEEHEITYFGNPLNKNHKSPNITEKQMNMYDFLGKFNEVVFTKVCQRSQVDLFINDVLWKNASYYRNMLEGNDMRELLRGEQKFDLFITLAHTADQVFQFAHIYDVPIVQIAPSIICPWTSEVVGNPTFYATDISFFSADDTNNFIGRLKRFMKHHLIDFYFRWSYLPFINGVTKQFFPAGTPKVEDVAKERTSLVLANTISHMGYGRANVPAVIEIGGLHCRPAKPLPQDLERFMQSSGEHGVVYFSLGGTIRGQALPEQIRKTILKIFSELPQKVLWKWEGEMNDLPPNVRISKWIPQQDVLGHEKIRVFITQGGMLSIQESTYHGVPVFVIPIILDQHTNADIAEENGYGEQIDICNFDEHEFRGKLRKMLDSPRYLRKAKEISAAIQDTDFSVEQKAKWWINFVLRHKHTSLRPTNTNYSQLDIYLLLLIVLAAISYVFILMIRCLKPVTQILSFLIQRYRVYEKTKKNE